ncbi:MAG: glutamine synthetase [Synechococcaceae cyanobacterium]|nr:glutamine synthetase [Synechococcaceae cyanobacterium]
MRPMHRGACERQQAAVDGRRLAESLTGQGLRRLLISFVNHAGVAMAKVVPLARLEAVARDGVGFSPVSDAWTVDGLPDPLHSLAVPDGDLRLIPDLAALLPLDRGGGWAWAPADRHDRDGHPYACDQRSFCRRQQLALAQAGLEVSAGFEIEWVVGQLQTGDPAAGSPGGGGWRPAVAGGPYGADRLLAAADYLAALADALDAAGLPWLQLHPEYGPGQFELSLAPCDPLTAADRQVAARLLIQRLSQRFGWRCSFSPLLQSDLVGNGGHLHLSVSRQGRPLLHGGERQAGLTPEGEQLIAALLGHLPELLPLACPLTLSYRRLGPGRWSAPFQAWGVENREAALRLIPSGGDGAAAHLELKVADLAANPYLLVGAVLAVLREGAAAPRALSDPVVGDPAALAAPPPRLPLDLAAASSAFAASTLLQGAMGERLHRTLLESQQAELRRGERLDPEALLAASRWTPASPAGFG